jgi:tetratricopeptide (TPR) repeat protein
MNRPTDPQTTETLEAVRLISAAIAVSDHQKAYDVAETAIRRGNTHPAFFGARALWLERQKRDEEALADFERSASLAPQNVAVLNAIGLCLTRLYRLDEAVAAFDEAIRVNPALASSYQRKGVALGMIGDIAAARQAYEMAIKLNPRDAEALANLATIAMRQGKKDEALAYSDRASKIAPKLPMAVAARALLANSAKQFAEVETFIRPILDQQDLDRHARAVLTGLLADALDGEGRYTEAFDAYRRENEELLALNAPRFGGMRSVTDYVRGLSADFQAIETDLWRSAGAQETTGVRDHVFLLGFYRSGTTLLGQVLESHPDIVTLEERDFLLQPAAQFLSDGTGLNILATLPDDELEAQRQSYWQAVKDSGARIDGKILVDKHPLNTIKLPLIAKLFPQAKIIFAIRDPRDVILSCFRRHFEVNAAMYDLLTLEGAADFYDATMSFAETTKPIFARPHYEYRYESLVSDFDGWVGALCEYLGVPYRPEMRQFQEAASATGIRSPSGPQVARELYREGVEQWRNYSQCLAPVSDTLKPWIEKFGYSPE